MREVKGFQGSRGYPVGAKQSADQPRQSPLRRFSAGHSGIAPIKGSKLDWNRQPAFSREPGDRGAHSQACAGARDYKASPWVGGLRSPTKHREVIVAASRLTPAEVLVGG